MSQQTFEDEFKSYMVNRPCEGNLAGLMNDCEHFWNVRSEHVKRLEEQLQRATDLVRYARHYLHEKACITDEEFAAIVEDSDGRVARLEGYDKAHARLEERIERVREALKEATSECLEHNKDYHHQTSTELFQKWATALSEE